MSSREAFHRVKVARVLHSLFLALAIALSVEGMLDLGVFEQRAIAQEDIEENKESSDEQVDESKDTADGEREKAEAAKDNPPAKSDDNSAKLADEDEVSETEAKRDREEDQKAAEEEASGAEVEIDDSAEVEEEPADSKKSDDKPAATRQANKKANKNSKRVIGATATIMERQSELLFRARVDSGAKSCSLHVEDYKIENEAENMADNIGKVVRFHIKNGNNEAHWLEAKIAGYVIVKTAAHRERRYKVPLTLKWKDVEKTVLVTLNNRDKMEFPLLLGRNFLMSDFVVDVEMDNDELHTR